MIETNARITEIKCDKCGKVECAFKEVANDQFYKNGWALRQNAKKYVHACFDCMVKYFHGTHSCDNCYCMSAKKLWLACGRHCPECDHYTPVRDYNKKL